MLAFAVAMAALGALFIAVGAALQERVVTATTHVPGHQVRFLLRLLRQPRWLLGAAASGAGVALHVVALANGPVSVIQPVGTTGLLFAVITKAVLDRQPVRPAELAGSAAVIAGLAGLLMVLPHDARAPQVDTLSALLVGSGMVAAVGVAAAIGVTARSASVRALVLAVAAGAAFGVGSALVRVLGYRTLSEPLAFVDWLLLPVLVLLVVGGVAQQHAYRMRRFALAFAVLQITDPVAAASTGVLLLGEPMPEQTWEVASMAVSATVITLGVLILTRSYAARNAAPEKGRTCAS